MTTFIIWSKPFKMPRTERSGGVSSCKQGECNTEQSKENNKKKTNERKEKKEHKTKQKTKESRARAAHPLVRRRTSRAPAPAESDNAQALA
jgi:hypothetical protein